MTDLRKRMLEELQRRNFSPITIRSYLRVVEDFAGYFGTRPDRLSQEDLRQYHLHLIRERKLAAKTVGLYIAALRFFFVKTLRRPYLKLDLPYPRTPKRLPTVLSQDEVARLIDSAKNLLDYAMLMTLYATGMRRAELIRLKAEDVDSERMIIHIRQGKGHRDRDVPLTPKLLQTLREYWCWMKPKTYLFPGMVNNWRADKPLTPKCVWSAVHDAAKRAGIKKRVSPHTLRHSWATHLLENGTDLRTIQMLMGHAEPASHQRLSAPVSTSPAGGHQSGGDHGGFQPRCGEAVQKKEAETMTRPTVEVADILRAAGNDFIDRHRKRIHFQQLKVMHAIQHCRTAALGGHIDACSRCGGDRVLSYNSCRNRHCPKCQAQARQRWIAARERELLATRYFHVVFTLPHQLHSLVRQNQVELYNLLFRTVAETLLEVARNPKHLGARIGFFLILHTWGQNVLFHPHIHCVIPAGGIAPGRARWIHPRYPFFLPVKVLGKLFRGKFVDGLQKAFRKKSLTFAGQIQHLSEPKHFAAFLRPLFRQDWVVYAKPAFGGPEQVLRYLGRYTHRVAISNHRLLSFDGSHVTFRWRDYSRGNKARTMTVSAAEFIRRFLLHVLPKGFVRIRHFGFMANSQRSVSMELCHRLLGMAPVPPPEEGPSTSSAWLCPICHAPMTVIERLTATELAWRFASKCFLDTS